MVALAIGTFFASFTIPARGLIGLLAALVGVGIAMFALTRKPAGRGS